MNVTKYQQLIVSPIIFYLAPFPRRKKREKKTDKQATLKRCDIKQESNLYEAKNSLKAIKQKYL